jgi:hypothetical protein
VPAGKKPADALQTAVQSRLESRGFVFWQAWLLRPCRHKSRLRAELERQDEEFKQLLEWVLGDSDALTTLQRTVRPELKVQHEPADAA